MNEWSVASLAISGTAAVYNAVLFAHGVGKDRFGVVNLVLLAINLGLAVRGAVDE